VATSHPQQVNKLALAGLILSIVGIIWTLLSLVFFTSIFSHTKRPVSEDTDTQVSQTSGISRTAEESSNFNFRDFYSKIAKGQSKSIVIVEAGQQPNYCSVGNSVEGYGEIEYCSWYGSGEDNYASITVTFVNQVVDGTSKVGF
jgi:hypothetical protein